MHRLLFNNNDIFSTVQPNLATRDKLSTRTIFGQCGIRAAEPSVGHHDWPHLGAHCHWSNKSHRGGARIIKLIEITEVLSFASQ